MQNGKKIEFDPTVVTAQQQVETATAQLIFFLPRDASAERGDATVSRPSVRLSLCL